MTDAELVAELREQAEMNELEFERVTLRLAADRLEALAAERDAALKRVAGYDSKNGRPEWVGSPGKFPGHFDRLTVEGDREWTAIGRPPSWRSPTVDA